MFTSSSAAHLLSPLPHHHLPSTRRRHKPTPKTSITCSSSSSSSSNTTTDALTSLGRILWGPSLPPNLLISAARTAWSTTWHLMMRQVAPSSNSYYTRPKSQFPTVPSRYYNKPPDALNLTLYAAHPCPWAHRTLILLTLLNNIKPQIPIKVSIATPTLDGAWEVRDEQNGAPKTTTLKEVYRRRRSGYEGRATVPMLWDRDAGEVVCNESYGIITFFNSVICDLTDLAPKELSEEIERWNAIIYPNVNNGVYRCGFAQSQEAYNEAATNLFDTLDMMDTHLSTSRYLCGDVLTLADVCLFTTLIRFDLVYNVLFKCTKMKLIEYPNLHAYTREIYQMPNVAATCNFEAIMDGYYKVLFPLNPGSIRPLMPSACDHERLSRPHNRKSLSSFKGKQPQLHTN